jgi:hypothetical protein
MKELAEKHFQRAIQIDPGYQGPQMSCTQQVLSLMRPCHSCRAEAERSTGASTFLSVQVFVVSPAFAILAADECKQSGFSLTLFWSSTVPRGEVTSEAPSFPIGREINKEFLNLWGV